MGFEWYSPVQFGIVPDTGVVFNQEVQHQKQLDATRNAVTCPGAQPLGTESLPRDILATLSDLYPRRLWGKPEEDLQDKPKYLLTLTVGLKQKNFVNQCVQKVFYSLQVFCVLMAFVCSGFERQFQCIPTFPEVT
jgi:hypothetical protein